MEAGGSGKGQKLQETQAQVNEVKSLDQVFTFRIKYFYDLCLPVNVEQRAISL